MAPLQPPSHSPSPSSAASSAAPPPTTRGTTRYGPDDTGAHLTTSPKAPGSTTSGRRSADRAAANAGLAATLPVAPATALSAASPASPEPTIATTSPIRPTIAARSCRSASCADAVGGRLSRDSLARCASAAASSDAPNAARRAAAAAKATSMDHVGAARKAAATAGLVGCAGGAATVDPGVATAHRALVAEQPTRPRRKPVPAEAAATAIRRHRCIEGGGSGGNPRPREFAAWGSDNCHAPAAQPNIHG